MKKYFLSILLLSQLTFGAAQVQIDSETTSDNIKRQTTSLRYVNILQNLLWPYDSEPAPGEYQWGAWVGHHQFSYLGQKYSGSEGGVLFGARQTTELNWTLHLGGHTLNPGSLGENKSIPKGELQVDFISSNQVQGSLLLQYDFFYKDMIVGPALRDGLTASTTSLRFLFMPSEKWRVPLKIVNRSISDSNQKSEGDVEAKYCLDRIENWIWIGVGLNQTTFTSQKSYWSPQKFLAYGPRAEFAFPIGITAWKILGEANMNWIKEDSNSATGHSGRLGIQWGNRNHELVSLSYFEIKTLQSTSEWRTSGLQLNAQF